MTLPPRKPQLTTAARRARQADRLAMIRLRMAIWRWLDERGITTLAAISAAVRMPGEAVKLLTGRVWREGDLALLEAVVARLGVQMPQSASSDWPN
jgi:hypothetical protein